MSKQMNLKSNVSFVFGEIQGILMRREPAEATVRHIKAVIVEHLEIRRDEALETMDETMIRILNAEIERMK